LREVSFLKYQSSENQNSIRHRLTTFP